VAYGLARRDRRRVDPEFGDQRRRARCAGFVRHGLAIGLLPRSILDDPAGIGRGGSERGSGMPSRAQAL
jgi:hypothetical protein